MKTESPQEKRIRQILYASVLAIVALYISQPLFIHLRLKLLEASLVTMDFQGETCNEQNCNGTWRFVPADKYLLLGHIMRNHRLVDAKTNQQILPISRIRGNEATSWSSLRVYSVEPGASYVLEATKPKAVRMGYFIGILPRTTNHEGILSVPDISPTITTLTTMAGVGVFAALIFAAFLAPTSGINAQKKRDELITISVSALAAGLVSAIGTGIIDSLLPDGELRSRIIRTAVIYAAVGLPIVQLLGTRIQRLAIKIPVCVVFVTLVVNGLWAYLRAGIPWIVACALIVLILAPFLWSKGCRLAAAFVAIGLWDAVYMLGAVGGLDFPPIYLLQAGLIASFSILVADLGAVSVISMASRAYQRFTRDMAISQVTATLSDKSSDRYFDISNAVCASLPKISSLMGAGRVTILLNLPFGRPITHSFTADSVETVTHDDGKMPGAVTIRSFVYGDETWFETYKSFAERLGIKQQSLLSNAEYVCCTPIRVNENNMGVLMLTQFDDNLVKRQIRDGSIDDQRETGRLLVEVLAGSFSSVVLGDLKVSGDQASALLTRVREIIPEASSSDDFLQAFCQAVREVTGLRTMLHKQVDDRAMAMTESGFRDVDWGLFLESPYNLRVTETNSIGGTVVAFLQDKSSYLKDWNEISSKLHPKTVQMLTQVKVRSIFAVPLASGPDKYVLTMFSASEDSPKDPGVMKVVESTAAIFDAALTVLNQRTSVLALGKLATRLIGDDDIRERIISAAKLDTLPTTIGAPRTSFLLLFDLIGSSDLPADTEEKARSYGYFYDEVNKAVSQHLGGKIRKTIGDAIIVTWDGTNVRLEEHSDILIDLLRVVSIADGVACKVGCRGVRAILHYGDYFFGLVGTSSFGQIDVIGRGIDEVCKLESAMKTLCVNGEKLHMAITVAASLRLKSLSVIDYQIGGFVQMAAAGVLESKSNEINWGSSRTSFSENVVTAVPDDEQNLISPNLKLIGTAS